MAFMEYQNILLKWKKPYIKSIQSTKSVELCTNFFLHILQFDAVFGTCSSESIFISCRPIYLFHWWKMLNSNDDSRSTSSDSADHIEHRHLILWIWNQPNIRRYFSVDWIRCRLETLILSLIMDIGDSFTFYVSTFRFSKIK